MTLTKTEALVYQCLRFWWSTVKRGKGGEIDERGRSWTRVSGSDAAQWIEQHYFTKIGTRQILRAFDGLVEKGFAIREQRTLHRWNRSYSYAPPETDRSDSEVTPSPSATVTADPTNRPDWAQPEDTEVTSEVTPRSDLITTNPPAKSATKTAAPTSDKDGGRPEGPEDPQSPPLIEQKGTIRKPTSGSLRAILERCEGIGRGELPNPWEVGEERRESRQVSLGTRLPEHAVTRHDPRDKSNGHM